MEENLNSNSQGNNITSALAVLVPGNFDLTTRNHHRVAEAWFWKDTLISIRDTATQTTRQANYNEPLVVNYHQEAANILPPNSPLIAATATATTTSTSTTTNTATTLSTSSPSTLLNSIDDYILQYVNLNLVRKMIAQNLVEILFICVIVIYLVFYFSHISRKPKLIGNSRSKFVEFIRKNLDDTISCRFNPLIYFWGTNPQTALFGYLQGQTSIDEMPRSNFQRQYLYVSDAQYLTSNVDLSEHYNNIRSGKVDSIPRKTKTKKHHRKNNSKLAKQETTIETGATIKGRHHFLQLQVDPACMQQQQHEQQQQQQQLNSMQLNKNICYALDNMLACNNQDRSSAVRVSSKSHQSQSNVANYSTASSTTTTTAVVVESESESEVVNSSNTTPPSTRETEELKNENENEKDMDMSSSKSGSLSDSGVFPGHSSSTSSSTSSLSEEVTMDGNSNKCLCKTRYETELQFEPEIFQGGQIDNFDRINEGNLNYNNQIYNNSGNTNSYHNSTPFVPREYYEFGQCALDWHLGSHKNYHKNKLVALISAGMTTGSDKKYVTDTVTTLEQLGYEVCVFIRRGVGGLKLLSTKFFSPAKWHDFEAAILSVRQQRPGAHLVAIGFSFGSIELCRYLSMSGKRSLIDAALLISCPFDPEAGGANMRKRTLNRKIDAYLARNLGKQLYHAMFSSNSTTTTTTTTAAAANQIVDSQASSGNQNTTQLINHNGSNVNLATLTKIKSLVDFERNYNRILQNYPSSEAYADDSRLHDHLKAITTPTLCLSSEDDFMAPLKLLPLDQINGNKNLCMILTKRGGHMAFIDGLFWPKKPYFAQRIISKYMKAVRESLLLNTRCSSSSNMGDISINMKNPHSFDFYGHQMKLQQKQQKQQKQHHQQQQQQRHYLELTEQISRETRQPGLALPNLFYGTPSQQYQHPRIQMFDRMTEIRV